MAYAKGIGGTRGGVIRTTFAEETETDLFGEQAVLCGGHQRAGEGGLTRPSSRRVTSPRWRTLSACHEVKLIVDLFYQGGLSYMRYSVSNTAEYGDYKSGPRVVTSGDQGRDEADPRRHPVGPLRPRLDAREQGGRPDASRRPAAASSTHQIEEVGKQLRKMMSWIDEKEVG